jgi:predicted regulator of Ras-like GTPase activity (Roadblock/LC7/MglB family)
VEAAPEAELFVPYPEPDVAPGEPSFEVPPVETEAAPAEIPGFLSGRETEPAEEALEPPPPAALAAAPSGPAEAPAVTETLAELLRAQGHLSDARQAYEELARTESDAERAERLRAVADEIAAARGGTLRGRLEEWSRPFSRRCVPRDTNLVTAVEHAVERLGRASAVVTDFEGVPVVSAGPRGDSEAMEILAAELTAFWKNVRRSRSEIGEGALDSLVLSGTSGTAAVKVITPAYALLVKAGPGIPAGRIRFEAARAAEQLRPALL